MAAGDEVVTLEIQFDWEEPEGARGPELRATWASLRIAVDGRAVTRVYDRRLNSVRERIYLPLYPVAEWLAASWWRLLHESWIPARSRDYWSRHNVRYGREGFALPDLVLAPRGESIEVQWQHADLPDLDLEFLGGGSVVVRRTDLERELRRLLDAVLQRLRDQNVAETLFEEEWERIRGTEPEEEAFARIAATVGRDPYEISEEDERRILRAHEKLQKLSIPADEFWHAVPAEELESRLDQLEAAVEEIAHPRARLRVSLDGRDPSQADSPPWVQGYEAARRLRLETARGDEPFSTFQELADWAMDRSFGPGVHDFRLGDTFEALAHRENGSVGIALSPKRSDSARAFTFARALYELSSPMPGAFDLVTRSRTDRQARNRAFAAELLAPADALRERLAGVSVVAYEDLEDLAGEFAVEAKVVEHQLDNHGIVDKILPAA